MPIAPKSITDVNNIVASASVDIPYPDNINDGDVLQLYLMSTATFAVTTPGFTQRAASPAGPATGAVYERVCDGNESGTFNVLHDTGQSKNHGWVVLLPPCDVSVAVGSANAASGNPDPPSLTLPEEADWTFFISAGHDRGNVGAPVSYPANYVANGRYLDDATNGGVTAMFSYRSAVTAGPEDPAAFVISAGDEEWVSFTAAIRPLAPAVLSTPAADTNLDDISVRGDVTTDVTNGTLYAVVGEDADMVGIMSLPANVKAGQDANGDPAVAAGNNTVTDTNPFVDLSGLTPSTNYTIAFLQDNGSDSNVVTATFTTLAPQLRILSAPATIESLASFNLTVENEDATEGTLNVDDGTNNTNLTITLWDGNGTITATMADMFANNLKPGTVTLTLTHNNATEVDTVEVDLLMQDGWVYETIGTPDTTGDDRFKEAVGQPTPESGDLIASQDVLDGTGFRMEPRPNQNYRFGHNEVVPENTYTVKSRFFDDSDHTWGAEGTKTINVVSVSIPVSISTDDTGSQLIIEWPENVIDAGNGLGAIEISLSGGPVTLVLNSGDGTTEHIYDITNRIVLDTEGDGSVTYQQTVDGFQEVSDSDDVPTFSITLNNHSQESDVTPPTVQSITIDDDSDLVTIVLDEPVAAGQDGFDDFVLNMSGGMVNLTNTGGTGTATLQFTPSRPVLSSETGTGEYTQLGQGVMDLFDNLLATIAGLAVTNDSELQNNGLDLSTLGPCRENNADGALLANLNDVRLIVFNAAGSVLFYSTTHSTDAQGDLANIQLPGQSIGTTTYVAAEHIATGFGFGPVAVPVSGL